MHNSEHKKRSVRVLRYEDEMGFVFQHGRLIFAQFHVSLLGIMRLRASGCDYIGLLCRQICERFHACTEVACVNGAPSEPPLS